MLSLFLQLVWLLFLHLVCVVVVSTSRLCCRCFYISSVLSLFLQLVCVVVVSKSRLCCRCFYSSYGCCFYISSVLSLFLNLVCVVVVSASHLHWCYFYISSVLSLFLHLICVVVSTARMVVISTSRLYCCCFYSMAASALLPTETRSSNGSFHLCRLFLSHMGYMAWEKRSVGNSFCYLCILYQYILLLVMLTLKCL